MVIDREYIKKRLIDIGIAPDVIENYDEPHRYYHNLNHIITMLKEAQTRGILSDDLFVAIVFHDIVYKPLAKDNELISAKVFLYSVDRLSTNLEVDDIYYSILDTADHKPTSLLGRQLISLDLSIFNKSCAEMIKMNKLIWKEFSPYVNKKEFKKGNLEYLHKFKAMGYNIDCLIKYVEETY